MKTNRWTVGNDYKNASWAPKPVPFYKRLIQAVTFGFGAVLAGITLYIIAVVLMAL